ncbi:MAG TPA: DUF2878 domain-containing protein [Xanthomonadales bacterium]|nr:DUF2878 domain-containing protein [Xanthomonadales bacterium]
MRLLVNFAAFQLGWFACVLGAAKGLPWLGPVVVAAVVALHLAMSRRPLSELYLVLVAMVIGLLVDSLLLATGWLQYSVGLWLPGLAPYWIIAMWALFATTLNVSMGWMSGRPVLAVLMGAIGGPLSYLAGEKLGAIGLTQPLHALAALSLAWAVAMPLLMKLSARLDGVREQAVPGFVQRDWRRSADA